MADLLIVCATSLEMAPFLKQYPGRYHKKANGVEVFTGEMAGLSYDLLITGLGVFNTAMVLTRYLSAHHSTTRHPTALSPGLILQTGIAGAFEDTGLGVGDLALATQVRYSHTGVQDREGRMAPLPFDLVPGQPDTRQGVYPVAEKFMPQCRDALDKEFKGGVKIGQGPLVTVSAISGDKEIARQLFQRTRGVMEAMEGAASAHVALDFSLPFLEIRVASNLAGERDKTRWDIPLACKRIPGVCRAVSLALQS